MKTSVVPFLLSTAVVFGLPVAKKRASKTLPGAGHGFMRAGLNCWLG
ncbi:MAG: hypothetical protein PHE83_04940 [Opitutaceae bacterium]|nr:hypothetical protein [Opitutaceae bacterium]